MVQHPWISIPVLLAGLLIALLPRRRHKNGNRPRTKKQD